MADNKLKTIDITLAYTLLRVIVGVNYFNHGFVRLGNMTGFAQGMVERFQDTFLPGPLVWITGLMVTPVEFVVGILITIGWFTRSALVATLVLMVILMYGITLLQEWSTASSQLVYDLILFILLAGLGFNTASVDGYLSRSRATGTESATNGNLFVLWQVLFGQQKRLSRRR